MQRRVCVRAVRIALALLVVWCCGVALAATEVTQNVFVVVIDGVRNTEAFEDPTHRYVPHLWNDLRPLGTIYTDFYNLGSTWTWNASGTIYTGVIHSMSWRLPVLEPSFLEYYRQATGAPPEKAYLLSNNVYALSDPRSEHPLYRTCAPRVWVVDTNDSRVHDRVKEVMDQHHPSVMYIHFDDTDYESHYYRWDTYVNAIRCADSLIYDLWQKIQANRVWNPAYTDTTYRNKTALIVTTDHGRHDNYHGGFGQHGDYCHGCRHTMFLAVGPEIKVGAQMATRSDQQDICPTVGALMRFETPLAQGRVLREMIAGRGLDGPPPRRAGAPRPGEPLTATSEQRLTASLEISRCPVVEADSRGVQIAWAEENRLELPGGFEVRSRRSSDGGSSWSVEEELFVLDPDREIGLLNPAIGGDDGTGIGVVSSFFSRVRNAPASDSTYQWGVLGVTRQGGPWAEVDTIDPAEAMILQNGPVMGTRAGVIEVLVYREGHDFRRCWSQNGGATWTRGLFTPLGNGSDCLMPSLVIDDHGTSHAAWMDERTSGDVARYRHDLTGSQGSEEAISPLQKHRGGTAIAARGDTVLLAWSDGRSGTLQVQLRGSPDGGHAWAARTVQLSRSSAGAWHCDVAVSGDTAWAVWEDYRDGNGEIYGRMSPNRGVTWGEEVRLTNAPGFSAYPRLAAYAGKFHLVWQDDRDGNFEVYYTALP